MHVKDPFLGISEKERKKILQLLEVHIYKYKKGQTMLSTIKFDNIIGIISSGYAEIIRINYNGEKNKIEELEKGSIFGSILSSIDNYDHEIIATEDNEVIIIDYDRLFNYENTNYRYFNTFLMNIFDIVNERVKEKNERIRILSKKTIRNKLLEYFNIEYGKNHSRNIYIPSTYNDLALYLATDRSALSRELSYMKEEGLIEIKGKRITILYKWFFYLSVDPNPPLRTPVALSPSQTKYFINTTWPIISPFLTSISWSLQLK